MRVDGMTPVTDVEFVAFDFETTGLHAAVDRIVEFGAVRFVGDRVIGEFELMVNPGIPITPDASRVSGISNAHVIGLRPVADVVPEFLAFIGGSVLIAHNAPFDLGFLRAAAQSSGHVDVANLVVDTQALAIKAFPRRRSYSLQNLALDLGLPPNRAHRALDDAAMCMRLFLRCVTELSFMGDLPLADVLMTGK